MTPLEDVFMLEKSVRLNFQTMLAIYKSGVAVLASGHIVYQTAALQGARLVTAHNLKDLRMQDTREFRSMRVNRGRTSLAFCTGALMQRVRPAGKSVDTMCCKQVLPSSSQRGTTV
jgi:hypothetical protein